MSKVQVDVDIPQTVNYVATTVNVGTTTTLPSGSNATVTNSGTESNAILNFGIPKGEDAYENAVAGGFPGTKEEFIAALGNIKYPYVHEQAEAATVWTVTHNLAYFPSVTVVDTANSVVMGDIHYIDENSLTITFNAAFKGKAYLN